MRREKLEALRDYIRSFEKVEENKVEPKGFLSIEASEYTLSDGSRVVREELIKNNNNGDAICVLPVTKEGDVVLVVQPRPLTREGVTVELPAGYIDLGETPLVSATRELKEETGYISDNIISLSNHYQDQGCTRALIHTFLALDAEHVYEQDLDKDEYIKYFVCKYEEALELLDMGYIKDSNSIITLERSKKFIRSKHV